MATNIPIGGSDYPTAIGNKQRWAGDHVGPANYQQPGEVVSPQMFGFPGFVETLGASFSGYSQSNNYFVRAKWPASGNSSNVNESSAPVYSNTTANNCLVLQWFIASNSAQVANNTNLAAEIVRLEAWGG